MVAVIASMAMTAQACGSFVQRGEKLTGGGEIGEGFFGDSVALSSDGKRALIGGPEDNGGVGAAWVFKRKGSTWTQEAKLAGGGEIGEGAFGRSVALSSDGNTALIGAPDPLPGAALVFTRSGSGWTQEAKLTGVRPLASKGSAPAWRSPPTATRR